MSGAGSTRAGENADDGMVGGPGDTTVGGPGDTTADGATPRPGGGGPDLAGVAREAWETRPTRCGQDAVLGGVAGAVARRYALDPTLVRVVVVALSIVGGGLLLYLLGWLLLPPDPADPPRRDRSLGGWARSGRVRSAPPLLVIATAVVAVGTVVPALAGRVTTVAALLLVAAGGYLLHTRRAHLGVPGSPARPAELAAGPPDGGSVPDSGWDPLGATPTGWRFPAEPDVGPSAPDDAAPARSLLTPVTLALALVAAGLAAAALLLGLPAVTGPWIPAAALAVVGGGLLLAGVCRRGAGTRRPGRGLIAAAVPLVAVTVLATVVSAAGSWTDDGTTPAGPLRGAGEIVVAPTAPAFVAPEYRTGLGDIDLDLTGLAVPPGAPPVRTGMSTGAGSVTVVVPPTADVTVSCQSGLGEVSCLGATPDGTPRLDLGPDGPGGPVLDLTLRSGMGDLEVLRG